ncbi:MAG: hypothetical protein Q9185_000323 [Variospora sp. 1 TL-2023]
MVHTTSPQRFVEEKKECDDNSESGSLLVHHGSLSVVPTDSPVTRTPPNPADMPFDAYTQQLGSHLGYRSEQSEVLALTMELESLLPRTSTPIADVHVDGVSMYQDFNGVRAQHITNVIAHVNRLFAEVDNKCSPGAEAFTFTRNDSLPISENQKYAGGSLYDLEKQIHASGIRSSNERRRNSAWLDSGWILCFVILGAAFTWHCLVLR